MKAAARIHELAATLGDALRERKLLLATAESCTGGGVAYAVTQIAGSSDWFERGFVTYSNEAKQQVLGVSATELRANGAVSEPVARAMASGALSASRAQIAVAITGIAGPGGGSAHKPVGTVCFGWALQRAGTRAQLWSATQHFDGDRAAVRTHAIIAALDGLLKVFSDDGRA